MPFRVVHKGSFKKTQAFTSDMSRFLKKFDMDKYGRWGVQALQVATPRDTGTTASSWKYRIVENELGAAIEWYNTNDVVSASSGNAYNVAVMLQYGHGTKNGGYVAGIDYINPAMQPIFESILNKIKEDLKA